MVGIDMKEFLRVLGGKLERLDVENLKFILADSFTGKFHSWNFFSRLCCLQDIGSNL